MTPRRLLVLHDRPAEVLPVFERELSGCQVAVATGPEQVGPAIQQHHPDAIFSIKHSGFPGEHHRPALHHPSVRWFHVGGSGIDHLGRWDPTRVTVTHSAGVLAPVLAEMALAAMLSLSTRLHEHQRTQATATWRPRRFRPLAGRTLLVVGVGHVGGALATLARGLGMRVVGIRASSQPHPALHELHQPDALHQLLPSADVVSLHVRLTPHTRGLIGPRELSLLPPGAVLLNSSRGAVVDEDALIDALDSHLGGAWLDVFHVEPLPSDHPLWRRPDVLLTPHCADQSTDFPARFARRFVDLATSTAPLPALSPP